MRARSTTTILYSHGLGLSLFLYRTTYHHPRLYTYNLISRQQQQKGLLRYLSRAVIAAG